MSDPSVRKKLRVKTVYSYNNYVSLPKYVPFLEDMEVEKTKLNITSFDKMERDESENPSTLASTASAATEPASSDLPF